MDVRAGCPLQNTWFSKLLEGLTEVLDRMSAGMSGPKLQTFSLGWFFVPDLWFQESSPGIFKCSKMFNAKEIRHRIWPGEGFTVQWKWSPPGPGSLKALLFPLPLNKVENRGTQGVRARYDAELPPIISIVRCPGRPVISVPEKCFSRREGCFVCTSCGMTFQRARWYLSLANTSTCFHPCHHFSWIPISGSCTKLLWAKPPIDNRLVFSERGQLWQVILPCSAPAFPLIYGEQWRIAGSSQLEGELQPPSASEPRRPPSWRNPSCDLVVHEVLC